MPDLSVATQEEFWKKIPVFFQNFSECRVGDGKTDGRVERLAQLTGCSEGFDRFVDPAANVEEHGHLGFDLGLAPSELNDRPILKMDGTARIPRRQLASRRKVLLELGMTPRLVRGQRQDRREDLHQSLKDMVNRGLRGAPQRVIRTQRVKAILEDIVVNRRKRYGAELAAKLVNAVEFVGLVGGGTLAQQSLRPMERPSVQRIHLLGRNRIFEEIEVEQGGVLATVRYIGIDTPEISLPNQVGECFGAEAKAENERLVVGQSVRLKRDESDTDKYGRLLRYVYQEDRFINLTLVLGGYAEAKTYSPNVAKQIALDTAETVAKAAGKGVWSKECKIRNR